MDPQAVNELFPHIRIVIGMVIGLAIARLLTGIARLIQNNPRPLDRDDMNRLVAAAYAGDRAALN